MSQSSFMPASMKDQTIHLIGTTFDKQTTFLTNDWREKRLKNVQKGLDIFRGISLLVWSCRINPCLDVSPLDGATRRAKRINGSLPNSVGFSTARANLQFRQISTLPFSAWSNYFLRFVPEVEAYFRAIPGVKHFSSDGEMCDWVLELLSTFLTFI